MPVTIKDLSQRCGLSVSAISKALNNYTDISEETRAYVRKVAMEMGYFPNAQARALKTNRSYNIGVVYEDGNRYGLMHYYFNAVLDGFKREIEGMGYDLTFINRTIGSGQLSYLNHCRYRGMDGALIACVDFYNPEVVELAQSEVPVVTIDHLFSGCSCVMSDNRSGMRELVRYVAQLGHTRIALVHGEYSAVTDSRVSSFYETMNQLNLPIVKEYVTSGLYHNTESNRSAVAQMLKLPAPPTCILMTDDFAALGGMDAIVQAGLRIPEDISVAGYDGIQISQVIRPRLTTVFQDAGRIGQEAAKRLVHRIEHPRDALPAPMIVAGQLLKGETVRQA